MKKKIVKLPYVMPDMIVYQVLLEQTFTASKHYIKTDSDVQVEDRIDGNEDIDTDPFEF